MDMDNSKNLVFIGDSLTQWGDWGQRFPAYHVTNLGISGETVEGLLARRERIRAQTDNPDFIFLMTGINNIASEQYDIILPYREIVRNLTTWYKQATVVVQSLLPVTLEWVSNKVIRDTNRLLEEIAHEYNAAYLDVYRLFVDAKGTPKSGYLSDDGVHLAGKGYDVWAREVEQFLNERMKSNAAVNNEGGLKRKRGGPPS
jgi:lysophospholipase L1-like esterase